MRIGIQNVYVVCGKTDMLQNLPPGIVAAFALKVIQPTNKKRQQQHFVPVNPDELDAIIHIETPEVIINSVTVRERIFLFNSYRAYIRICSIASQF